MKEQIEKLEFFLKSIRSVADRRKTRTFVDKIEFLLNILYSVRENYTNNGSLKYHDYAELLNICNDGLLLADSLAARTKIEIREVLYPLPEIKRDAREFGTLFFNDYFVWKDPDREYSPESLMAILENDLSILNEARDSLRKIQGVLRRQYEERIL